jgi:hypothetical protein
LIPEIGLIFLTLALSDGEYIVEGQIVSLRKERKTDEIRSRLDYSACWPISVFPTRRYTYRPNPVAGRFWNATHQF